MRKGETTYMASSWGLNQGLLVHEQANEADKIVDWEDPMYHLYHGMYASFFFFFLFISLSSLFPPSLTMLTYAFRGMPIFHIHICPCLLFRTYIVLHGTHLFPSFNIPFAGE